MVLPRQLFPEQVIIYWPLVVNRAFEPHRHSTKQLGRPEQERKRFQHFSDDQASAKVRVIHSTKFFSRSKNISRVF